MNLLTCSRSEFKQEIEKISDIVELKVILRNLNLELVKKLEKVNQIDEKIKNGVYFNERERLDAIREMPLRAYLRYKIKFCQDYILMLELQKQVIRNAEPSEAFKNFSWGVIQRKEPKKLFEAKRKYAKSNKIEEDLLQVTECGKLFWEDKPQMTLKQLFESAKESDIIVGADVSEEGNKTINADDVLEALQEEEATRGQLRLIRINIADAQGKRNETGIDYMMLIASNNDLDWSDPELQAFFAQIYLSNTFVEVAGKMRKKDQVIYGGKIIKNNEGQFEVSFDDTRTMEAVAKANKTVGTAQGIAGNIKDDLGNVVFGIHDALCGYGQRSKKVRHMFEELLKGEEK